MSSNLQRGRAPAITPFRYRPDGRRRGRLRGGLLLTLALHLTMAPASAACPGSAPAGCVQRQAADGTLVQYPRLHWSPVATAGRGNAGAGFDLRYLQGMTTRVTRHVSAAALGLPGNQVSRLFYQPPGAPPLVFARFAPGSNLLRIDILRVERGTNGSIAVTSSQFGPHQGERFVATQDFISAADRLAGRHGRNPFALWLDPADDVFHNICFQCTTSTGALDGATSGVTTAVGIAMQQVGAQLGIIAVAHEWIDVQQQTDGGLLWSTVTVKTLGYAQPDWWIASPIGAQLGATSQLGICLVPNETPCASEHQVRAGVAIGPWTGPNLPNDKDLLYYSEDSHTGFTVLGYAIVTALLVGAGSYVWGGMELGGGAGLVDAGITPGATGISVIGSSAVNAGLGMAGYLGTSNLLHPGSSDRIQSGYLGQAYSTGQQAAVLPSNEASQNVVTRVKALQIQNNLSMGLTGVQKAYAGSCAIKLAKALCSHSDAGLIPRTDDPAPK